MLDGIEFFAATDVGRVRDHNEDNYLVDRKLSLFIVADGMGGHAAGEVASALAVRTVHEELQKAREVIDEYTSESDGGRTKMKAILTMMEQAVQRACTRIHAEAAVEWILG